MIGRQNHREGCLVYLPDLVIAVNREAKTIFVRGQPEDVEAFKSWVLAWDQLASLGRP